MARARVSLWAICMLRVALATVYFQEEFLDGERWRNRWVQSTNDSQFGHFRVSSGKFYGHKEKDKECFAHLHVCAPTVWSLQKSEESIGSPGTRVTTCWEPPCGCENQT